MPIDKEFKPGIYRIFVFGSNHAGVHGAGAAKTALDKYDAIWGMGEGLMGNSYAIPTKDKNLKSLSLDQIEAHVKRFLLCAEKYPHMEFFVTRIGCGLAGFTDKQIAPFFKGATANVELPYGWENPEAL